MLVDLKLHSISNIRWRNIYHGSQTVSCPQRYTVEFVGKLQRKNTCPRTQQTLDSRQSFSKSSCPLLMSGSTQQMMKHLHENSFALLLPSCVLALLDDQMLLHRLLLHLQHHQHHQHHRHQQFKELDSKNCPVPFFNFPPDLVPKNPRGNSLRVSVHSRSGNWGSTRP